jgi:hypothetical protein
MWPRGFRKIHGFPAVVILQNVWLSLANTIMPVYRAVKGLWLTIIMNFSRQTSFFLSPCAGRDLAVSLPRG